MVYFFFLVEDVAVSSGANVRLAVGVPISWSRT